MVPTGYLNKHCDCNLDNLEPIQYEISTSSLSYYTNRELTVRSTGPVTAAAS